MVIHVVAPMVETMMTGVASANQRSKGGPITLVYSDGTTESAPSMGKRIGRLESDGSVSSGDFSSLFDVVSHVQGQRR